MMNQLRSIAVTVCEPDPGLYCWVLLESVPGSLEKFHLLSSSQRPQSTYDEALAQGVEALRLISARAPNGPRAINTEMGERDQSDWVPLKDGS